MDTGHNKAIVERIFVDVNDGQRYELLDGLCHPDMIIHDPIGGDQQGVEAFRGLLAFFRQAFGEQRTELSTFIAEGEYVALLHTHHARNTGSFMGAPPTNSWIAVPGLELFRFKDGKIAEFWRFDADFMLLAGLGLLPAAQAA
jgi:predicted ester cyclase